jgi:hypothetical protein
MSPKARRLRLGGQTAWAHDEGHPAGTFHTYDALDVSDAFPARKVHVFLPRGWETARRRYPLVVMHDGDTAFWRGGAAGKTWDVAGELSRRLTRIFLRDESGRRPVFGGSETFQTDPHWRDYVLFYEYFHGDRGAGIGASHQTGWTGLVAKLIQQSGE